MRRAGEWGSEDRLPLCHRRTPCLESISPFSLPYLTDLKNGILFTEFSISMVFFSENQTTEYMWGKKLLQVHHIVQMHEIAHI